MQNAEIPEGRGGQDWRCAGRGGGKLFCGGKMNSMGGMNIPNSLCSQESGSGSCVGPVTSLCYPLKLRELNPTLGDAVWHIFYASPELASQHLILSASCVGLSQWHWEGFWVWGRTKKVFASLGYQKVLLCPFFLCSPLLPLCCRWI